MLTYNRIDGMGEVVTALAFKIKEVSVFMEAKEPSKPIDVTIKGVNGEIYKTTVETFAETLGFTEGGYWVTYTNPMNGSCYFNEKAFYDLFSLNEFIGIDQ